MLSKRIELKGGGTVEEKAEYYVNKVENCEELLEDQPDNLFLPDEMSSPQIHHETNDKRHGCPLLKGKFSIT